MTNPLPQRQTQLQLPIARLLVRKPGQDVVEVELTGRVSIGRAFDNVIPLDDTCISRYHAMIEPRSGDCWITDLNSRNGTTVNGELIKSDRRLRN
ncbi:MAG TPA: FHA domain-containing protein, partial [Blastocatellia bacterium]|nr:FHA domain-containing protein [Blastocatellia bacterium]